MRVGGRKMETHLNDEEQPPVCDRCMRMLDAKRNEPAKRPRHGGEPEPIRHTHAHFILRVEVG